jgi:hypothetical protein
MKNPLKGDDEPLGLSSSFATEEKQSRMTMN